MHRGAVRVADPRTITFAAQQLQRKFKQAAAFGVTGKYSRQSATRFERAMCAHVEDGTTLVIPGTYRGTGHALCEPEDVVECHA